MVDKLIISISAFIRSIVKFLNVKSSKKLYVKKENIVSEEILTKKNLDSSELQITLTPIKFLDNVGIKAKKFLMSSNQVEFLQIVHEKNNKYDSMALKVFYNNIFIGYIMKKGTNEYVDKFCFFNHELMKNITLKWNGNSFLLTKSILKNNCNSEKSYEDDILDKFGINYLYHMTHINNLKNILDCGILSHGNKLLSIDISNQEVNNRRNKIEPIYNKSIHSYVPFYFNPKNAMLYTKKDIQDNMIILAIDRRLIYQEKSIFTDGNAASNTTKFYNKLIELKNLNWSCIYSKTWFDFEDGKRLKMAEVLIYNNVPSQNIIKVYCNNYITQKYAKQIISKNININVEINSNIFF